MKKQLKRILYSIKENKIESFLLAVIILVASFLRFYKITELYFFTYDQARDDLIVKRILVDHKLTLLGPQSSMRGVYLPPFYYYTLAPVLWVSRLNPVGVDIYTAVIGVLTVTLIWYMAKKFFGRIPGLMVGALYATSPLIVELSRHAWNPNTQPFFVLLTIWFLYRLFKTKKEKCLIFVSLAFGYAVNLHYGALCLLPIWLFAFSWLLKESRRRDLVLISLSILFFFFLPLLLFDLRHNFMLTKNIYTYFFVGERVSLSPNKFFEPMVTSIYQLLVALLSGSFVKTAEVPFEFWGKANSVLQFAPVSIIAHKPLLVKYQWWGVGLLLLLVFSLISFFFQKEKRDKKDQKVKMIIKILLATIFVSSLVSRFYIGKFYFFYYIFLYPSPFLFLGFLFWFWWQKKIFRPVIMLIFLFMFSFNLRHALVFEKPERTIKDIISASQVIAADIGEEKSFVIAANYRSPDRWDHNAVDYRYFVEAYFGKRGLDWQPKDYRQAQILYVVAEGGLPDPINAKIMEIYEFGPKKIEKTWELPKEVYIYKMRR